MADRGSDWFDRSLVRYEKYLTVSGEASTIMRQRNNSTLSTDRNILAISQLERQGLERRTGAERFSDQVTHHAGRLWSIVIHVLWFGIWVGWNTNLFSIGADAHRFDPFPFPALTTAVSLEAIFLSLFILMSENRSNRRADERAHLDLQINLLSEHETTTLLKLVRALCLFHKLPEANDPEVAELLQRTEPAELARKLERQLPSDDGPKGPGTTPA